MHVSVLCLSLLTAMQVSEHASWCISFYARIMEAALAAAGAPAGLVSFVTGYGDAGHALVTGGVDKVGVLEHVTKASIAMTTHVCVLAGFCGGQCNAEEGRICLAECDRH
jgi:hypothetical protein